MAPPGPSGRKRVISEAEEPSYRKRSRMEILPPPPPPPLFQTPIVTPRRLDYDRFTMPLRLNGEEREDVPRSRPLSTSSSITAPGTPSLNGDPPTSALGMMRRSASFSSFHSQATDAPTEPYYPDGSAKFILRDTRLAIDFSLPSSSDAPMPLSCSSQNVLYFSRGNRVHCRNMIAADAVGQLCKLQEKHGDLKLLAAGDARLALATSKGVVQIWDTDSKKMIGSWTTKGVASMAWNGKLLSIGGLKGAIRIYDTRIEPISKMKEQVFRVTRHQTAISALSWNRDGKLLASGDESGIVYCWDARSKVPLDVGEFVQRRKKIGHQGAISALAWCPWQAKLLATGDISGTVKLWTVDAATTHSNATAPSKLELGSKIVNLHFSPNYKELVSTLGSLAATPEPDNRSWLPPSRGILSNAIVVHSFPTLRQISTVSVSDKEDVCGSVLSTGAGVHKIVVAVPGESKLKVFDVWGKRKEIRRQASFLGNAIR